MKKSAIIFLLFIFTKVFSQQDNPVILKCDVVRLAAFPLANAILDTKIYGVNPTIEKVFRKRYSFQLAYEWQKINSYNNDNSKDVIAFHDFRNDWKYFFTKKHEAKGLYMGLYLGARYLKKRYDYDYNIPGYSSYSQSESVFGIFGAIIGYQFQLGKRVIFEPMIGRGRGIRFFNVVKSKNAFYNWSNTTEITTIPFSINVGLRL